MSAAGFFTVVYCWNHFWGRARSPVRKLRRRLAGVNAMEALLKERAELAARYLKGEGVEVGACDLPLVVPEDVTVRYLDRVANERLHDIYPQTNYNQLVPVTFLDDAERLATLEDNSIDFIIAAHVIEHCQDPIRFLQNHIRVLKPGGIAFIIVPDKRYTFGYKRPVTTLRHLICDHEKGPESSLCAHYAEWLETPPAADT